MATGADIAERAQAPHDDTATAASVVPRLALPVVDVEPRPHPSAQDRVGPVLVTSEELRADLERWTAGSATAVAPIDLLATGVHIVVHRYSGQTVRPAIHEADRVRTIAEPVQAATTFGELLASIEECVDLDGGEVVVEAANPPDELEACTARPARLWFGLADDNVWLVGGTAELPADVARRCLGHVREVLAAVHDQAEAPKDMQTEMAVVEIPIVTAEECEELDRWNETSADYPLDVSYAEAFERQVQRSPDRIALREGDRVASYEEVDRAANAIGLALHERGIGPEDVVAVAADRSLDTQLAIMGILKSGAAYLPLDGGNPAKRMAATITIGDPVVIIVAADHAGTLRAAIDESPHAIDVLSLDELLNLPPTTRRVQLDRDPSDLGYVIPTSGSTGQPKAAMVEQRSMMNHLWGMVDALDLSEQDVLGQSAPLTFDISVWQMLTPLLIGGQVAYAPDDARSGPDHLLAWIGRDRLTIVQLVPSLMSSILQIAAVDDGLRLGSTLRWVIPTGEALPSGTARRWLERFVRPPLVNAYGPAECADDVTLAFIDTPPPANARSMPIGRPVGNAATYVLDPNGGRLPVGIVGEIAVGGTAVGRGYRGDAARTAEAFEANPVRPFGRRYRTGDLGRFLADGSLEYVGRVDHQVKIRGQRIELGDVESAVVAHPSVGDAIAAAVDGDLLAFYTGAVDADADAGERAIHAFVADRLPGHMCPKRYVSVDRFPLNANGKVDRQALERLASKPVEILGRADRQAASTTTEAALVSVWGRVLDLPEGRIGVHDDFFDLGGSSLSAAVMLWHIDRDLGVDLPLTAPVERRTVSALAGLIDGRLVAPSTADDPPELVELAPGGERIPLFMAPGQGGSVLGFVPLSKRLDSAQPCYGLDLKRRRNVEAPPQSFESLVAHHRAAIKSRFPTGPYVVGGWCMGGEVAIELARRLRADGDEVPLVVLLQTEHLTYPVYRSGTGSLARLRHRIIDRVSYERTTVSSMPRSQRSSYLVEQLLAKIAGKLTDPAERAIVKFLGHRYRGSERYHRNRWAVADGAVYDNYECAPYDGDVVVVYAKHQPRAIEPDPSLGWRTSVTGALHLVEVDGYHWNILREPQIGEVADGLETLLASLNGRDLAPGEPAPSPPHPPEKGPVNGDRPSTSD